MQYKINISIRIRYLSINLETGLTDLILTPTNPSGVNQTPITLTEIGDGLYETTFTPNALGWWWVRVSSVSKPVNVYSKNYYVGTTDNPYPTQEDGKITSVDTKLGEVQTTPTVNTLLGRLKDLWDKLNSLFIDGLAKVKLWDGTTTTTVDNKTTSAKGLNTIPLGKSTGTYYPNVDEEEILNAGDLYPIKTNADGMIETRSAVFTDEGSIYDTFKGNTLHAEWNQVLGAGASLSVANSRVTIGAGTTANAESYIDREIDYMPIKLIGRIYISQRILNQDIYFELSDGANPGTETMFARFHWTGVTNTLVRCETQSSSDTNGNEGLAEDFLVDSSINYLRYQIIISEGNITFIVQSVSGTYGTICVRANEIPDLYTSLNLRIRIKNGAIAPVSNTNVIVDWIKCFNFNNVSISDIGKEVISVDPIVVFKSQSMSEIVDISVPISTDYWILNLKNTSGIIDEIHIVTDSDKFLFKIDVDEINYFDEKGADITTQYRLGSPTLLATYSAIKNIESTDGKDLHWILPISFNSSIRIGVRNNTENNKKIKGYIILYKIR